MANLLPLDLLIKTWLERLKERDCSEEAKAFFKPPSFHISNSGRICRGVEQGTDRHVLLVELEWARQIRMSLIQHLLREGRTETRASDRDNARLAWLSSLTSPIEHLWKQPASAPLRACWCLGVLTVTCNSCAVATLCCNWRVLAACFRSQSSSEACRSQQHQTRTRLLSWLVASGWLAWLIKCWGCGKRWSWIHGWQPGPLRMHWLLHYHVLHVQQPEQDGQGALEQLHLAGLIPQQYNLVLGSAQHRPAPKVASQHQQHQNQQLSREYQHQQHKSQQLYQRELEQLLPDPQALLLGGEPKRYEGIMPVFVPDEASYRTLIKDLNKQQKAKNEREKRARKQAASIAAAKEQLALACALVAPRPLLAAAAGNATASASASAGPAGLSVRETMRDSATASQKGQGPGASAVTAPARESAAASSAGPAGAPGKELLHDSKTASPQGQGPRAATVTAPARESAATSAEAAGLPDEVVLLDTETAYPKERGSAAVNALATESELAPGAAEQSKADDLLIDTAPSSSAAAAAAAAGHCSSVTQSPGQVSTRAGPEGHVVLLSIDLEWYERSTELLLEIGWTLWDSASRRCTSKHWIVSEGLGYANGRYVPNMRDAFKFGTSQVGKLADGVGSLQADIDAHPGLILVGHDMTQDMQMLAKWGIQVPEGTQVLDTSKLAWARVGDPTRQAMSLRTLLAWLQVPDVSGLHNGGNDARFTMEVLLKLCAPEAPVGVQNPTEF
ncbi:hypothetical protein DUNSADRAFT_8531 [Dunaliella salina]|uniref:Gfd2/YDR514C-like C-terminal domain-containing protein n=1 Tax=Dunaliella salina TaxID=3046 RepID=A0ABQ7GJC2_DUNSA|nr:hypothetical protein DUNSADRAFT_8531 [Dunaliella salina]|eukprot:KAF5834706.1 hypothetical protein DUNSADRAFT_8531 [Dunaliella salina]